VSEVVEENILSHYLFRQLANLSKTVLILFVLCRLQSMSCFATWHHHRLQKFLTTQLTIYPAHLVVELQRMQSKQHVQTL